MTFNYRKAYSVVGVLLLLEFLVQFYVIAASMFSTVAKEIPVGSQVQLTPATVQTVEPFAAVHAFNGVFIIPPTILILIGLSFGARYPWRTTGLTALLFLLMVVQFVLAVVGFLGVSAVAGLHGINALLLVGLGIHLVTRNWEFGRGAAALSRPEGSGGQ